MKIVCDEHIPFLVEAVRREWQEVEICPMNPDKIDANTVRDADILALRTRTKVNGHLLKGSRVRMVCTATIGFDHIDTAYCDAHHIRWTSCPGCNAQAVCNYIEEALDEYLIASGLTAARSDSEAVLQQRGLTLGIVGVGHVGSRVARMAERKGLRVLLNDPPQGIGVSLGEIAENCDIITFHVPLTMPPSPPYRGGRRVFPTWHLCDGAFLAKCKPGALIINAARGGVVDEQALLLSGHPYILDTWENEPHITPELAQHAFRASMHIAGYSLQGKRNATQMCLDAIAEAFSLPRIDISLYRYADTKKGDSAPGWLARISDSLKKDTTAFELLRKSYLLREE
ncbi:MAG: 4-phosphoerythronate dehydrogenase [Paludibacteraceae bacterium]|nr:4-phosphoerythronate dehydrogenase [Paludibacteraceae bacterium]